MQESKKSVKRRRKAKMAQWRKGKNIPLVPVAVMVFAVLMMMQMVLNKLDAHYQMKVEQLTGIKRQLAAVQQETQRVSRQNELGESRSVISEQARVLYDYVSDGEIRFRVTNIEQYMDAPLPAATEAPK